MLIIWIGALFSALLSVQASDYIPVTELNTSYNQYGSMNWVGAVKTCALLGGQLWAPKSPHDALLVVKALCLHDSYQPWVGYKYEKQGGNWISTEGEELPQGTTWVLPQPAARHGKNCAAVDSKGNLQVWDCNSTGTFICEAELEDILKTNSSALVGYNYLGKYRALYRWRKQDQNWEGAQKICKEDGGQLWAPALLQEAKDVLGLWETDGYIPWVGLTDITRENIWTPDGKDAEPTLYTHWAHKNPEGGRAKNCAAIDSKARLYDWDCTAEGSYICKIGPVSYTGGANMRLDVRTLIED